MTDRARNASLAQFSAFVERALGLHFPEPRWADLDRGLRLAGVELGFDEPLETARWLMSDRATKDQVELLAAHLTIGETYFFRDPKSFEALETTILPELIRERRSGAKRLRIWSAGCCTGEEPYSIAIALNRALPEIDDWRITILATDVNARFLQKAMAGVYTAWSFRAMSDEMKRRFFTEIEPGRFQIDASVRNLVTFQPLNLVADPYPSLATNTNAMDIVFCRNVLMYFSMDQARRVVAGLQRCLVEPGWLFASASEAATGLFAPLAAENFPGTMIYKRPAHSSAPAQPHSLSKKTAAVPDASPRESPADFAAQTRDLANRGRLAEAIDACDRAIAADKLCASLHYLRGMILQEQGDFDEAASALERALLLDPRFVLAHFSLANLMHREGRGAEAQHHFANARSLLKEHDPDAPVPESEGITAGRMLELLGSYEEAVA